MVQRKSRFRNLKRGDGTSQKFVSGWYFQVWKFQFCLLASKYFMSVNNCSCSHINFGQTGGDLSFEFHIHFKDIGHMASSTVNFSCFKTPPALHSVAKCLAASTQHWRLWKTKLQILQLSGAKALDRLEYRMIFTAESAFWTSGLWRRAFYVRRSLKGSKWTNLVSHFLTCSQRNKKYWLCWQSSTAFGFAVLLRVWIDVCQRHWPHGVFHQKMRSRNLQFLCSLWQLGFFLNVNFSSFKTPPALHSVAKCFAAST